MDILPERRRLSSKTILLQGLKYLVVFWMGLVLAPYLYQLHLKEQATSLLAPTEKTLLLSIFSTSNRFERRSLIRMTTAAQVPEQVDVRFVVGKPKSMEEFTLLAFENATYHDLIILDVEENMDSGKTVDYMTHVHQHMDRYHYVMKTDDDVFHHIPNLLNAVSQLPRDKVYFGRPVIVNGKSKGFHAGAGYILSWDMVEFIATNIACHDKKVGQEDSVIANCLYRGKKLERGLLYPTQVDSIYDEPEAKASWSHSYTNNTLFIHRLKRTDWFLKACTWFYPDRWSQDLNRISADLSWNT